MVWQSFSPSVVIDLALEANLSGFGEGGNHYKKDENFEANFPSVPEGVLTSLEKDEDSGYFLKK